MKKNNLKGFTLIEIIMSIVLLSIVSVVILNLFITSDNLNTRASDKSIASLKASNAIESFVATHSEYTIENIIYYDENWQEISDQKNAHFYMSVIATGDKEYNKLINIVVAVYDIKGEQIVTYETSQFLSDNGRRDDESLK